MFDKSFWVPRRSALPLSAFQSHPITYSLLDPYSLTVFCPGSLAPSLAPSSSRPKDSMAGLKDPAPHGINFTFAKPNFQKNKYEGFQMAIPQMKPFNPPKQAVQRPRSNIVPQHPFPLDEPGKFEDESIHVGPYEVASRSGPELM